VLEIIAEIFSLSLAWELHINYCVVK